MEFKITLGLGGHAGKPLQSKQHETKEASAEEREAIRKTDFVQVKKVKTIDLK